MVEFALVATLFFFFLLGIVEFGLAAWDKNSAASDARAGARYAIVRGASDPNRTTDAAGIQSYVRSRTSLDSAGVLVSATWSPNKSPTSIVTVQVSHFVPRRGIFIPAHWDTATTKMVVVF